MVGRMKPSLALALLILGACGGRRREPEPTSSGTSLDLHATTMTPQVHLRAAGDGGANQIQIGNVQAVLPGEAERGRAAERATQEGAE